VLSDGVASATFPFPRARCWRGDGIVTAVYPGDAFFSASGDSTSVAFKREAKGSVVVPFITPNPVYRRGRGANWPYYAVLTEKNGVNTTLTGFTVDGVQSLTSWSATLIPGHRSISASFAANMTAPRNRLFHFEGKDQDGTTWTAEIKFRFSTTTLGP